MYVVPPMDEEPPPGFVAFVADRLDSVRSEAARLTGGSPVADDVAATALSDVALHWRRLQLRHRLTGRDEVAEYLHRRLAARTAQWREDQIYPVEVQVLRPPTGYVFRPAPASIALRKAALLADAERARSHRPLAEAAIAWEHAWQRARWHRIGRMVAGTAVGFLVLMYALPQPTP